MQFLAITAVLIAAVSALPTEPATPFVEGGPSTNLAKRGTIVIDVYNDYNFNGRHEGLITERQRCYPLTNGWNDAITSLKVPRGQTCIFYRDGGCGNTDDRLTVSSANVPDLRKYAMILNKGSNFSKAISSYFCD